LTELPTGRKLFDPAKPSGTTDTRMHRRYRSLLIALFVLLGLTALWFAQRPTVAPPAPALKHSYSKALEQAHNGQPGAARVLYQQLARTDLSDIRRATLYAELPNYPSPLALKLATADLHNDEPLVRHAAIDALIGLVPGAQRSLLLGPLLEDDDSAVAFHAARGLIGLSGDELGLYLGPLQEVLDAYVKALEAAPDDADGQLQLARIYLHERDYQQAGRALARHAELQPMDLSAIPIQVQVLEAKGKGDQARQVLADQLLRHPQSALLQQQLGLWLMAHDEDEYALLALARAVELEPDNNDYRYVLATNLHDLEQVEAAQKQLEEILRRDPANRKARVLLIDYWKETGQLQNVQILQAELEQQNPDDPSLQQGL